MESTHTSRLRSHGSLIGQNIVQILNTRDWSRFRPIRYLTKCYKAKALNFVRIRDCEMAALLTQDMRRSDGAIRVSHSINGRILH